MKIGFWNVERLGEGTSEESKTVIANAVEWFFDHEGVELFVFCEITSNTVISSDTPVDLEIDKIATVKRRLKKIASAQLGYAVVYKENCGFSGTARPLTVPDYDETYTFKTYKKTGNRFSVYSKRQVLEFDKLFHGIDFYFFHANSSSRASYLVAWVAEHLRKESEGGNPFVLVGDLNCEPAALENELKYYDHDDLKGQGYSDGFHIKFAGNTHHARKGASKVLDYAITTQGTAVTIASYNTLPFSNRHDRADHPDHFPVVVEVAA